MLQAANTDLFNSLVPEAQNIECQNIVFPLKLSQLSQWKLVCGFFLHPRPRLGTNGLIFNPRDKNCERKKITNEPCFRPGGVGLIA